MELESTNQGHTVDEGLELNGNGDCSISELLAPIDHDKIQALREQALALAVMRMEERAAQLPSQRNQSS